MEECYTPLVEAVTRGYAEITRVLLEHGANAAIRAPKGQTLMELARENGHQEIMELLSTQETRS
jgi:ankyrin repeat protein